MKKNMSLKRKKPTKAFSSIFKIIALLVVVSVVVISAVMFGRISTENRGQAAYDPVNKCMQSCNNEFVKDKAACKADCLEVKSGKMTCNEFCTENVRYATNGNTNSITVCNKTCKSIFNPNPCVDVCKIASKSKYATKCNEECKEVENEKKSCAQAFNAQVFPGAPAELLNFAKTACVRWFGNSVPTPTPSGTVTPTPTLTATPTPTPTVAPHNCAEVCSDMNGVAAQICQNVCSQFNNGARTCPSGCNNLPSQYKQKCMAELCPTI